MYQEEIIAIKADLGISDLPITWRWVQKPHIKKNRSFTRWGEHQYAGPGQHTIVIATQRARGEVLQTIAHELRHAWQTSQNVLVYSDKRVVWTGTQYSGAAFYSKRKKYSDRPHEIDARAFEKDAWLRLFAGAVTNRRIETPASVVAAMFEAAWDA